MQISSLSSTIREGGIDKFCRADCAPRFVSRYDLCARPLLLGMADLTKQVR